MTAGGKHLYPVHKASRLEGRMRRLLNSPERLLKDHVKPGMRVMDLGCGPGFYTLSLAAMVREEGHVIAADLQQGMLERLAKKIESTSLEPQVLLHQTTTDRIGVGANLDVVLAIHVLHEVTDSDVTLGELFERLREGGMILLVEPKVRVSRREWMTTVRGAVRAGFELEEGPYVFMGRSAVLRKPFGLSPRRRI